MILSRDISCQKQHNQNPLKSNYNKHEIDQIFSRGARQVRIVFYTLDIISSKTTLFSHYSNNLFWLHRVLGLSFGINAMWYEGGAKPYKRI